MNEVLDPSTTHTDFAPAREVATMPGFTNNANWELAQRIGKAFAASSLVPAAYQNNLPNCIVALEMANRMGAAPLLVMQNLYIVHGSPGWSSKFLIASFNQCGRFTSLRYDWNEKRDGCRAWAVEKSTGERIEGPLVTLEMAKAEGWSSKNGSKWKTMPELMLMYRAAAFLIRTYAPEISMGLQTDDEIIDITPAPPTPIGGSLGAVRAAIAAKASPATPPPADVDDGANESVIGRYMAAVDNATSAETAALAMDEARDELDAVQLAALSAHYASRWPEAA